MQHCWCALFPLELNTESTLWSAQSKIVHFLHLVLVSSSILSHVSNERFIMQCLTDVMFCSKHHILISNTATKKIPEDKEFGYYSTVIHQRVEGEFPVAASVSVWWGEEQVRKHFPHALSLLPFKPSLHGAVAVPQPLLNTRVCCMRGEFRISACAAWAANPCKRGKWNAGTTLNHWVILEASSAKELR